MLQPFLVELPLSPRCPPATYERPGPVWIANSNRRSWHIVGRENYGENSQNDVNGMKFREHFVIPTDLTAWSSVNPWWFDGDMRRRRALHRRLRLKEPLCRVDLSHLFGTSAARDIWQTAADLWDECSLIWPNLEMSGYIDLECQDSSLSGPAWPSDKLRYHWSKEV